ncbi:hypothetical protein BO78DRAFT_462569 [Aspergillus sclerotiicarbonarius CBS 121057]|uniref:Uncharacterized protein n=1 Tax=Aspergillus sclerotiicarbonarius (strain CBS 121057 / IBT 28362) TaxID=1448318 RepID=A0A319E3F4_ASPSB|nr:hypothetical protein BO78DRAFT_462569 [Aspergillus sclerotiicarbonarius CBS 121057]
MSKDSTPTQIHMHHPRLADYFEDFTRPHHTTTSTSTSSTSTTTNNPTTTTSTSNTTTITYGSSSSPSLVPSYLPIEEIYILPQYQPPNPEDEDDVVPDQHAAFGITRAMRAGREAVWRDLGLEGLVSGVGVGNNGNGGKGGMGGRVGGEGRLMGGRRVVCLR